MQPWEGKKWLKHNLGGQRNGWMGGKKYINMSTGNQRNMWLGGKEITKTSA
jgi:hypothetical protein